MTNLRGSDPPLGFFQHSCTTETLSAPTPLYPAQAFCTSTDCRHALLVNHFEPGVMKRVPEGGCRGGCDNCALRAAGTWATRDFGKEVTRHSLARAVFASHTILLLWSMMNE